ncbi:ROK family protein [Geminicoccaceae bacterium 1502E]|uniref:ROK family protein n=1 Tax=Marinimicrococcus flavescens TaxID=3031815 RepID=A0AAP3XPC7_9PROT|nr:ROK family protein [Marinimicrococcus flavescens]MDX6752307.1 ROK family protein [Geminicoccaceae bacterium 1502E]
MSAGAPVPTGADALAEPGILVLDVGGNAVKFKLSSGEERRKFPSGPGLTPERMVEKVLEESGDWRFDRVSIGCPGPISGDRIALEPVNLGPGWCAFDFAAAFGRPVRLVNDAAMQALGSYEGGKMLFLGLGTGLGAALVIEGAVLSLEVAHLPYKAGRTFEDYAGRRGLERMGKRRWRKAVRDIVERLRAALVADHVVLGGGNAGLLEEMPEGCRRGHNRNAFLGGVRLWEGGVRVL